MGINFDALYSNIEAERARKGLTTAITHNLSIITEENKDKPNKIPQICKKYNISTFSLIDFWEKEGLSF